MLLRARRAAVALLAALAALACAPAAAPGDGDPASDVLLVQNVFFPYQPKVSPGLEKGLEAALADAAKGTGIHWKVAIVRTSPELGLEPQFFGRAQAYAAFLDREISFTHPQSLITVMPSGLGVIPVRYAPALAGLEVDRRQGTDGLTRSAIAAVLAVSRQDGHPIPYPAIGSGASGSSPSALVFVVPLAALLLAGLLLALRGRRGERGRAAGERDG